MPTPSLFPSAKPPSTRVYNVRKVKVRTAEHVYSGRAGHGEDGRFGNPFSVQTYGTDALPLYRKFLGRRHLDAVTTPE